MYNRINLYNVQPNDTKSFVIDKFFGVDYTRGSGITDYRRSPDAKNTIWSTNPYVFSTRKGRARIIDTVVRNAATEAQEVYGLYVYEPDNELLAHIGDTIYLVGVADIKSDTAALVELKTGLAKQRSKGFMFDGKLYIVGAGKYMRYDGTALLEIGGDEKPSETAYVPTTTIGRHPHGGGTAFEEVNMLSRWRKNSFYAASEPIKHTEKLPTNGTLTEFTLSETDNITYDDFTVTFNGNLLRNAEDYDIDRANGKITFEAAPASTDEVIVIYYTDDPNNPAFIKDFKLDSGFIDYRPITITMKMSEVFIGDGVKTEFTLNQPVWTNVTGGDGGGSATSQWLEFYLNGEVLTPYSALGEWTVTNDEKTITFQFPPAEGDVLNAVYTSSTEDTSNIGEYARFMKEGVDFTVDRMQGIVHFTNAPKAMYGNGGVDNIIITFYVAKQADGAILDNDNNMTGNFSESPYGQHNIDLTGNGEKDTFLLPDFPVGNLHIVGYGSGGYAVDIQYGGCYIKFDEPIPNEAIVGVSYIYSRDMVAPKINDCTIFGIFGGDNNTRVFLSGNTNYPNADWHSGLYDPTYFPDTGYQYIGNDSNPIMGYVNQYDTQMIIKKSSQDNASAYLRIFALDGDNVAYFPVSQGAQGIGAISKNTFAYLQGEPLFLAPQGVVGVSGTNVDNQRLIQDRSEKINSRLLSDDLENALGIEFENKYYLFVNRRTYVCDARMRYTDALGHSQYEWMHWEGIPATAAVEYDNYLILGFKGMLYRLKKEADRYSYMDEDENGNRKSIISYWTTPRLFFGSISNKKKLKFMYMLLTENTIAHCKVTALVDDNTRFDLGEYVMHKLIDFSEPNFAKFSFRGRNPSFSTRIRILEKFDNVIFKFEKTDDEDSSLGIETFQCTYQFLNR